MQLMNIKSMLLCALSLSPLFFDTVFAKQSITLSSLAQLRLGDYDQGAAEVVSYDPATKRAFVINGQRERVDVLNLINPATPVLGFSIDLKALGKPNSIAAKNSKIAVAIEGKTKQALGSVAIFDTSGNQLAVFDAGYLPDMVTFSPDGNTILVANEGEPNNTYSDDPAGSITIIKLSNKITESQVIQATFDDWANKKLDPRIRTFKKSASLQQDLEPEYITVCNDNNTAYVSLQENNAIAIIDIQQAKVTQLFGLGTKSYNTPETAIDASDEDNKINIQPWPVLGMYQPDSIACYETNNQQHVLTANEGDSRDYDGYSEEKRVAKLALDHPLKSLASPAKLGRLKVSIADGSYETDQDGNGKIDTLYSFGARSFSIWKENGERVFDSGNDFATITANRSTQLFNQDDSRSDNKGGEPEALTIGNIGDQTYAFIGLERTSGVFVYNITNPEKTFFEDYFTTFKPSLDADHTKQGDIAPETLEFISADDSPNGQPLLLSANEVSGTLGVYAITVTDQNTID